MRLGLMGVLALTPTAPAADLGSPIPLERRVAELERRVDAIEKRFSEPVPVAMPGPAVTGTVEAPRAGNVVGLRLVSPGGTLGPRPVTVGFQLEVSLIYRDPVTLPDAARLTLDGRPVGAVDLLFAAPGDYPPLFATVRPDGADFVTVRAAAVSSQPALPATAGPIVSWNPPIVSPAVGFGSSDAPSVCGPNGCGSAASPARRGLFR